MLALCAACVAPSSEHFPALYTECTDSRSLDDISRRRTSCRVHAIRGLLSMTRSNGIDAREARHLALSRAEEQWRSVTMRAHCARAATRGWRRGKTWKLSASLSLHSATSRELSQLRQTRRHQAAKMHCVKQMLADQAQHRQRHIARAVYSLRSDTGRFGCRHCFDHQEHADYSDHSSTTSCYGV